LSKPSIAFNSLEYWRNRYAKGQNSGGGSYGQVAEFKAVVLNRFIREYEIARCIEFGCGDGNQLGLLKIPEYLGLDVAPDAIDLCVNKFVGDPTKSFLLYDPGHFVNNSFITAELTLSMDVILHLVEEEVYTSYMHSLFAASSKYVAIFTTATDTQPSRMAAHNKFRDHRRWISKNSTYQEIEVALAPNDMGYPDGTGFYFYSAKKS